MLKIQFYNVERKAGWDTHGLPVELGVEKDLGITKDDIGNKISVTEYNNACKKAVMKYTAEWESLTKEMGYWIDLSDPYVTYTSKYGWLTVLWTVWVVGKFWIYPSIILEEVVETGEDVKSEIDVELNFESGLISVADVKSEFNPKISEVTITPSVMEITAIIFIFLLLDTVLEDLIFLANLLTR